MQTITANEHHAGIRLDRFLQTAFPEYSRTDWQKIIESGKIKSDGKTLSKNFRIDSGVQIIVEDFPQKQESFLEPENIPLNIVYEDEHLLVINKPRNMVMHPGNGISKGTLAAALLYHFKNSLSQINGPLRPGILHRLDKDTPGLLVAAKTDFAHKELVTQLEARKLERTYRALIWGRLRDREGVIDAPIEREPKNRLKMSVQTNGKTAITHYRVLETFPIASLIEWKLETGRTHQIRVHSRYCGNPVVGDPLYEGCEESAQRIDALFRPLANELLKIAPAQLLQSFKIKFEHPKTKEIMEFEIPMDEHLQKAMEILHAETSVESQYNASAMQLFPPPQIYANQEDIPQVEDDDDLEEEPVKERPTRAERYAATKIKRALKRERQLLRLREEEKKANE